MTKETFDRSKPNINIGTIGHVDYDKAELTRAIINMIKADSIIPREPILVEMGGANINEAYKGLKELAKTFEINADDIIAGLSRFSDIQSKMPYVDDAFFKEACKLRDPSKTSFIEEKIDRNKPKWQQRH